jgi:micrococcal nuclease
MARDLNQPRTARTSLSTIMATVFTLAGIIMLALLFSNGGMPRLFEVFVRPGQMSVQPRDGADTFDIAVYHATVTAVADGDSLVVRRRSEPKGIARGRETRIRIEGIDCPEFGQAFRQQAKQFTVSACLGRDVEIHPMDQDRYGRVVARIFVDGQDLSVELLRAGLAWHFERFNQDPKLAAIEAAARLEGVGLWSQAGPMAPWDWRDRARDATNR